MAAPSSSGFAADSIHQAAVAGAPGALPTHQEALTAPPPPPQRAPVMEMVQQPQGAHVMEMVPPMTAEATMGPPMTATQLLLAVEMIARLPLPTAASDFFDMPFGQQMTGCEQEMAGFNESIELPYGPYIHNEMPSVDFMSALFPQMHQTPYMLKVFLPTVLDGNLHIYFALLPGSVK